MCRCRWRIGQLESQIIQICYSEYISLNKLCIRYYECFIYKSTILRKHKNAVTIINAKIKY